MPGEAREELDAVLAVGDWLTVPRRMLCRGGQRGEVVDVFRDGVGLDFYTGPGETQGGLPSIEFYTWRELGLAPPAPHREEGAR